MAISNSQPLTPNPLISGDSGTNETQEAPDSDAVELFRSVSDEDESEESESRQRRPNPLIEQEELAEDAVADFEAGNIDAVQLEISLLNYVSMLNSQGYAAGASDNRGHLFFRSDGSDIPRSVRYLANQGEDTGNGPLSYRFTQLNADDQLSRANMILSTARQSAPSVLNPYSDQQIDLALDIVVPLDAVVSMEQIGQQAVLVQSLASSTLVSPKQQSRLREATVELARMYESAGIARSGYSINETTGDLSVNYTIDNPPPASLRRQYQHYMNTDDGRNPYWRTNVDLSQHSVYEQRDVSMHLVSSIVLQGARHSFDHVDVFAERTPPPSDRMLALQRDLDHVQPPDASVDLDEMYNINAVMAQMAFQRQDLKQIEYRSNDAARAALGDQGFSLARSELSDLYRWIEGRGVEQPRYSDGDNGMAPMSERERQFLSTWGNTSKEARLEYLGIDADRWEQASPHIDLAMQANKMRRDSRFGLDDLVKIGLGFVLTKVTAGALGPAVSGWLSSAGFSAATSGAIGTTFATAVGSALSTYVQTGKWSIAREAFKGMVSGDLKDGLVQATLARFGVNPQLAELATADNREDLIKALGHDLLDQFSPDVIKAIKEFSPQAVDNFLDGLNKVIQSTDDPDIIAEYTASWWGTQLCSLLGVKDAAGVEMVSQLLRGAVSDGKLDMDALRGFVGGEIADYLSDLPEEVLQRLGGKDNMLAVISGMATKFVLDNDFDLDAAKQDLRNFVNDMAKSWAGNGGLKDAISWLPGSETWSTDFHGLTQFAQANGWDSDAIEGFIAESPLIRNIIDSYVPGGVAQNMLARAFQFAAQNDFDHDTMSKALTGDLIDIISGAGISKDIVRLLGGDQKVVAQMTWVFGERFIANGGDIDATLADMRNYASAFAAGHIGEFGASILSAATGSDANGLVDSVEGLIELGASTDWDRNKVDTYVSENMLKPLGTDTRAMFLNAFGGQDSLVAALIGSAGGSYIASGGDSEAARSSAIEILMSRFGYGVGMGPGNAPGGTPPIVQASFNGTGAAADSSPQVDAETGLQSLASSAHQCLAEQVPIPGMPMVNLTMGALFGADEQIEAVQAAIDYLNCKGKADMAFNDPEKTFMRELFEAFDWGGWVTGRPEAAMLAGHYVHGHGAPIEINSQVYEQSVIVADTTTAMQAHISDLAANGEAFETLSTSDASFLQSEHIRDVMRVNDSRDIAAQGYVSSDGLVVAEQGNERLQKADNRFHIESSTIRTESGGFETTFTVSNVYDFEPYAKGDKFTELWLDRGEGLFVRLPDGLSEYMDSGLAIAEAFEYHAQWTLSWN